jgi:hypothetical protein
MTEFDTENNFFGSGPASEWREIAHFGATAKEFQQPGLRSARRCPKMSQNVPPEKDSNGGILIHREPEA